MSAPAGPAPLARLEAITQHFNVGRPNEQQVLHGVSLTLHRQEFAALIGPSGSGKSTLLNVIGLLEQPSGGTYELLGEPTTALDDAARTRLRGRALGFVFQFHHLLPAFSALENVLLPVLMRDGRIGSAWRARGRELLASLGLAAAEGKRPGELSGGMQQRVAIARALVLDPPLVLADEPTGNLDTGASDEVFSLLRRLHAERGIAFLVVTHDPRLAARCDRIVELVDGRVRRDGPPTAAAA